MTGNRFDELEIVFVETISGLVRQIDNPNLALVDAKWNADQRFGLVSSPLRLGETRVLIHILHQERPACFKDESRNPLPGLYPQVLDNLLVQALDALNGEFLRGLVK